jgi:polyferredoxin
MKRQTVRKALLFLMFSAFPALYYYLSPYLIVDATLNSIIAGSFIVFAVQFALSLFLGRLFCGWVCPAGGAQETVSQFNPKRIKKGKIIKWLIWLPWVSTIIFLAVRTGGYKTVDPIYKTMYGFSISDFSSSITYFLVLLLILLPAFILGKRSFCHHVCWMAPFMILGEKIGKTIRLPRLKFITDRSKCVNCHSCTQQCPMSLEVEEMVQKGRIDHADCIKCYTCIDVCRQKSIRSRFGL